MTDQVRIDYPEDHDAICGMGSFRILESFADAATGRTIQAVRVAVGEALKRYPELTGETVTVARRQDWDDKLGRADMLNRIVYLPAGHPTSFITAYHELGHLAVQLRDERGEDVPTTSEEYCSLLAMSRMPPKHIDEDRIPYFPDPTIDQERWPTVCAAALRYREDHRDYIQTAEAWLTGEEPVPDEYTADGPGVVA